MTAITVPVVTASRDILALECPYLNTIRYINVRSAKSFSGVWIEESVHTLDTKSGISVRLPLVFC